MTTSKTLLWTTYVCGLVPCLSGLLLFFSWWIGKAWFLTTIHSLEMYGLFWIFISIPVGLIGLLTGLIFMIKYFKDHVIIGILGIVSVLINIPVLLWILEKQNDIAQRAYVEIDNQTNIDIEDLSLTRSDFIGGFKSLNNKDSKIRYFYPKYYEFDSSPATTPVKMTVKIKNGKKSSILPFIYKGECVRFYLDKDFRVIRK